LAASLIDQLGISKLKNPILNPGPSFWMKWQMGKMKLEILSKLQTLNIQNHEIDSRGYLR
jgi:hypothetical protein